jgi:P-type Ca2+ transporter type 2C
VFFFYAEILPREFGIGDKQLTTITRDHNFSSLQEYGGACTIHISTKKNLTVHGQPFKAPLFFEYQVKGLANLLKTNLEKGIHGDEADLSCRANAFGANRYPRQNGRSFWVIFVLYFTRGYTIKVIPTSLTDSFHLCLGTGVL